MTNLRKFSLSVVCATLGAAACGGGEPAMSPAAARVSNTQQAVERIAAARCEHLRGCDEVGSKAKYSSTEHCMNVMREQAKESVGDCRQGVDSEDVHECLAEIKNQDCSGVIDSFERSKECSMDDLCLD
jgi:hypothetical protein